MAITTWLAVTTLSGSGVSPALRVPSGTTELYVRMDSPATHNDPTETVEFQVQTSDAPANNANQVPDASWKNLIGGGFVGGQVDNKTGEYAVVAPVPGGARWVRSFYTITPAGASVNFGVSGEFR